MSDDPVAREAADEASDARAIDVADAADASAAGTVRGVPAALRGGPYRAPGPCTLCRVVGS